MHNILIFALGFLGPIGPSKDCDTAAKAVLVDLQSTTKREIKAGSDGNVQQQIIALREIIAGQIEMSKHCPSSGKYDSYNAALNGKELAVLLAGTGQLAEAEREFRLARDRYKTSGVAGSDTYADIDLLFAYVLRIENKTEESDHICKYWKNKVAKIGREAVAAAKNSEPTMTPYDTPDQEIGRWNLFCTNESIGIAMLNTQIAHDPTMLAPVSTLSSFFILKGDFEAARDIETKWHKRLAKD